MMIDMNKLSAEQREKVLGFAKQMAEAAGMTAQDMGLPEEGSVCAQCGEVHEAGTVALAKLVESTTGNALQALKLMRTHLAAEVAELVSLSMENVVHRYNAIEHGSYVVLISVADADSAHRIMTSVRGAAEELGEWGVKAKLSISKPFKVEKAN